MKATDHELQKYDIFTRYGQQAVRDITMFFAFRLPNPQQNLPPAAAADFEVKRKTFALDLSLSTPLQRKDGFRRPCHS